MPVFPLVASTIVVRPGSILPSASAASIIATPIRSLTLPPGLSDSSLANSSTPFSAAGVPSSTLGSATMVVPPTSSEMLIGILATAPTIVQRPHPVCEELSLRVHRGPRLLLQRLLHRRALNSPRGRCELQDREPRGKA